MPIVRMPNGDQVRFPDEMPPAQISAFIASHFPDDVKSHFKDTADAIKSGMSYTGTILPFRKDESGLHLAVPTAIQDLINVPKNLMDAAASAPAGSRELTQNLVGPATDAAAAYLMGGQRSAAAGTGRAIAGTVPSPAATAAEKTISGIVGKEGLPGEVPRGKEGIATLADVGGENLRGKVERLAQTPGGARSGIVPFLTERQTGQLSRISSDLKELTGVDKGALAATKQQIEARSKAAAPLYESAFNAGDRAIFTEEMARLTGAPEVQDAMNSAVRNWQGEQIANGYGAMNPTQISKKSVEDTAVGSLPGQSKIMDMVRGRVPAFPNLQFWDYTKGALDSMIEKEIKDDGTLTRQGRKLTIFSNILRKELFREVPQYEQATQSWAGPSAYMKAIRLGKGIKSSTPEEVSGFMTSLSETEKEAYRIGAVAELLNKAGGSSAKLADIASQFDSPNMRSKLSAIMPNAQAAVKWSKRLAFERRSSELVRQSLGGSQTFRRLAEADQSAINLDDIVSDLLPGMSAKRVFVGLVGKGYSAIRNRLMQQRDEELAKRLMGRAPLRTRSFPEAPQGYPFFQK